MPADPADPDDPGQITPAMVLQALRRVGLPAAEVRTDPADKTLVNLDTIFSTTSETTIRTLSMLGHRVEVEATPSQWVWDFDDGISASTSEPGRPYPHKDLTHRYREAGVTVRPSVDVSYQARFRVEGGPWTTIQEAVTITGPTTRLRVAEAIPVLSGNR
ncbi:MAG: hypothetical protein HZY75_03730 [Nocardioidaceae bacterium]|nr:MAG: hypothetical protein HZY75_03730 [Nocardioidaceae bacterium]